MSVEDTKQSQFSPGSVSSDELLLRVIFFPEHIDDDGNLLPEAITTQDLRQRGFSVHRNLYVRKQAIVDQIERYVSKREERKCNGIAPANCGSIRAINDISNSQAFHVIDDACQEKDFAHAKILFSGKYGRAIMKSLKDRLKGEFQVVLDSNEVMSKLPSESYGNRCKRFIASIFKYIKS